MFKKILQRSITYQKLNFLAINQKKNLQTSTNSGEIPEPEFNEEFYCNPANKDIIKNDINHRKFARDIDKILELVNSPKSRQMLLKELEKLPNLTDPRVLEYNKSGKILRACENLKKFEFTPKTFSELSKSLKLLQMDQLGPIAGPKSYILLGDLAQMEEALIQYTVRRLMKKGFKLVSVPDILPTKIIERCGLVMDNERHLVYNLGQHYDKLSLSGTAEMALAMKLMNCEINVHDLPLKLAAVSRCFRAEISNSADEHGIYRVHQFTKVEMFACTDENSSSEFLEELKDIQEDLFTNLGLQFQTIDMPSHELGAPAYRKIDIEGWLPGKKDFGELSSCSNCTDYQSRRLKIRYKNKDGELKYVHTLNDKLVPFMNGKSIIEKQNVGDMRIYKQKKKQ
ncbi:serine--tRNA ligase, mitochondrial isoform X2 [Chelonus insularis]|uniref:serine--tRNA ligase, mitochondrial isoform X2 n=1 Tax=Chelonus insularis TaxID=460826 RepID=UPI00158CE2D7|nr:serine--tRNA ligase, mitochondrial isoform X2 [Chelonus insularis]